MTTPTVPQPYKDTYSKKYVTALGDIGKAYQGMNWNYTPTTFRYQPWNNGAGAKEEANRRVNAEYQAIAPQWQQMRNKWASDYQAAVEANKREQESTEFGANKQGNETRARLANMMANTGMGGGQSALGNVAMQNYDIARQLSDISTQYGVQRGELGRQYTLQQQQQDADEATYRASMYTRAAEMSDALANQDFERYQTLRNQAFTEWSDFENRRAGNYENYYTAGQNKLSNLSNVLQSQYGIESAADAAARSEQWNRYNAQYTGFWDSKNFEEDVRRYGLDYALNKSSTDMMNQYYQAQINALGNPGSQYGYGGYTPAYASDKGLGDYALPTDPNAFPTHPRDTYMDYVSAQTNQLPPQFSWQLPDYMPQETALSVNNNYRWWEPSSITGPNAYRGY